MDRILRFAAAGALGLAFAAAAPAAKADSHSGVTVGGWIEVIGGTAGSDVGGVNGISRGLFSRIAVSYDTTLDNGLTVSGRAAYQLNQRGNGVNITENTAMQSARMDASTNYAPDVLYISVGGGFGTVTVGAAAPASCSTLPRPIAFVNGVNSTHYTLFTGLGPINGTFSEYGYCGTPEQVSYTTPTVGGFKAMLTYAPDDASNQGTPLKNAQDASVVTTTTHSEHTTNCVEGAPNECTTTGTETTTTSSPGQGGSNVEDRIDVAVSWSSSMGAASFSIGAGFQQGQYQVSGESMGSAAIATTIGFGGLTLGAKWYERELGDDPADKDDGYTLAAKYSVGNLTLGTTWSTAEKDDGSQEDEALVFGASYAVGGGLTTWIEYMDLETDKAAASSTAESDDIILVGVTLGF